MRFSPTETASPERAVAREVRVVEPETTLPVPFSPAEGRIIVPRGILEDELAHARAMVATD